MFARLRNDLGDYIVERGAFGRSVWAWYHRQFWESALLRYMVDAKDQERSNKLLSDYFSNELAISYADRGIETQPLYWTSPDGDVTFNGIKLSQLPVSLLDVGDLGKFQNQVCNLEFVAASCTAGLGQSLIRVLANASHVTDEVKVRHYYEFVTRQMHILEADPAMTLQLAHNAADHSYVCKDAEHVTTATPWLTQSPLLVTRRLKPTGVDPCICTFNLGGKWQGISVMEVYMIYKADGTATR